MKTMKCCLVICAFMLFTGCVNKPTRQTTAVDDRPRITLDARNLSASPDQYRLLVDGVDHGWVGDYLSSEHALRMISGRHKIQVTHNGVVIFEKDVTLGENETRTIRVHEDE